jgi:hypothetical protein
MQQKPGRLFLIPVPIGETTPEQVIPAGTLSAIRHLKVIIAENAKTARAFLKQFTMDSTLQEIEVLQMDKHGAVYDFNYYFEKLRAGSDTGLMSEAGMPAVADPGAEFVKTSPPGRYSGGAINRSFFNFTGIGSLRIKWSGLCLSWLLAKRSARANFNYKNTGAKCFEMESDADFY